MRRLLLLLLTLAMLLGGCAAWEEPDDIDLDNEWENYQPIPPIICPVNQSAPDFQKPLS